MSVMLAGHGEEYVEQQVKGKEGVTALHQGLLSSWNMVLYVCGSVCKGTQSFFYSTVIRHENIYRLHASRRFEATDWEGYTLHFSTTVYPYFPLHTTACSGSPHNAMHYASIYITSTGMYPV